MYTGGCLHCTFDKSALFQQIKTKCWYNNPGRNWRVKPVPKRESCSVGKSSEWSCCEVIWNMPRSRGHGYDLSGAHRNSQHLSAKEAGCLDRGRPGLPRRRRLFFLWCVCVERDGSILLLIWSCMCHFLSCVFIRDPHPTSVLLSTLRLLCLVTSTLLTSHTGLQTFLQFGNFPYLRGGLLKSKAKGKDEKMR